MATYISLGEVYVARHGELIVGYAQSVDSEDPPEFELKSLAVIEARQGEGSDATWSRSPGRAYRAHDLRHADATLMLEDGQDLMVVSRSLGHSQISTTADVYAHLTPAMLGRSAARMDAMRARRRPGLPHPDREVARSRRCRRHGAWAQALPEARPGP